MQEKMDELKKKWLDEGFQNPFEIRVGINTGFCNVGNFGSEDRLDYTIIGGEVNLASRLESNAKTGEILVSHETFAFIKEDITCEKKEEINVKGIAHKIQTYQVIENKKALAKKHKFFNEQFEGFTLKVDLNSTKKERIILSLKKAMETLKKIKK